MCASLYTCVGCICIYVLNGVCATTYISKKISVDRCLDPHIQRVTGQHPGHLPVCASQFTEVWRKGWGTMTYQRSQPNFAE